VQQGFLFSKAVPGAEFVQFLRAGFVGHRA
jgi:sensor c-di-GMP phosphodiesterase-like protein